VKPGAFLKPPFLLTQAPPSFVSFLSRFVGACVDLEAPEKSKKRNKKENEPRNPEKHEETKERKTKEKETNTKKRKLKEERRRRSRASLSVRWFAHVDFVCVGSLSLSTLCRCASTKSPETPSFSFSLSLINVVSLCFAVFVAFVDRVFNVLCCVLCALFCSLLLSSSWSSSLASAVVVCSRTV
jgi:hypothetical protein